MAVLQGRTQAAQRLVSILAGSILIAAPVAMASSNPAIAQTQGGSSSSSQTSAPALQPTSSAFAQGDRIPSRYTCDGEDLSPPLTWGDAPTGTQSFALILDDPDAPGGTFVHWVVYNLPASVSALSEGIRADSDLPEGAVQGRNDFRKNGYGGPCPPRSTHRYFFTLYALDKQLTLASGASKEMLLKAMEGHILAEGQLMGTYRRK